MPCCAQPCECHCKAGESHQIESHCRADNGDLSAHIRSSSEHDGFWNPYLKPNSRYCLVHILPTRPAKKWHGFAANQKLTKWSLVTVLCIFVCQHWGPHLQKQSLFFRRPQEPFYPTVSRPRLFSRVNSRILGVIHDHSSALTLFVLPCDQFCVFLLVIVDSIVDNRWYCLFVIDHGSCLL